MAESNLSILFQFTTTSHLNDTHSLQWSEDDNICLLTDKGAFIFTPGFAFSDSCISLYPHKHFIPNPTECPSLAIHTTVKRFIDNQRPECDWFDHIHLTEGFSNNYTKYQLAAWSPRVKQFGSILALLTYDHRLNLYFSQANEWKLLADCSNVLDGELGAHYKGVPLVKAFQLLSKLTINCMVWSSTFEVEGNESLMLICCTNSGHIHFFRFVLNSITIELANSWKSGLGPITYSAWFRDLLVICPLSGQLIVLKTPIAAVNPAYDDWSMISKVYPWKEEDDIPVQNIVFHEVGPKHYKLFFTKNCAVVIADIKEVVIAKKLILQLCGTEIIDTNVMTRITGLTLSPDKNLILSSIDRLISILKIDHANNNTQLVDHPINSDEVGYNLTPLGLTTSRNHILTCLAQTMTKFHDHLLLKEPTRIIIFPNVSLDSLTQQIEFMTKDQNLSFKLDGLRDIMDWLNALRGYYTTNLQWIPTILEQLLTEKTNWQPKQLNSLNFKLLRFVAIAYIHSNPLNRTNPEYEAAIIHLEELILREHVEHIYKKFWSDQAALTKTQILSLHTVASWASKFNPQLKIKDKRLLLSEKCPICDNIVNMESFKEGKCSNNHSFGRCANSLLICDLISVRYEICKLCGRSLYSVPSIWPDFWECLYCC